MQWNTYNDALVKRGEILLDFSTLETWNHEVKRMNVGKRGAPYTYPESLITVLATLRLLLHLPYRQLEGVLRGLSQYVDGLTAPDYSTLDRRINRLTLDLDDSLVSPDTPTYIAVDSTGIKVHKSGDWIRTKCNARKGYLKIHIAVNVETGQVVALAVTREHVHDGTLLESLVESSSERVEIMGVIADGAYDSVHNFTVLSERGIEPLLRVRKSAVPWRGGCTARSSALNEQRCGSEAWRQKYGLRWRVESAFSWIKRVFGEYVAAKTFENMAHEILMKVCLYNRFMGMARGLSVRF